MRAPHAVLLDLDPVYDLQPRLRLAVDRVLPVPPLPRWLCPVAQAARALRFLRRHLPRPCLVFTGSGDYHYLTALLIRRVREPFTLILVDRHADEEDDWGPGLLSCGGWIRRARRWPWLQGVVHLGRGPLPAAARLLAAVPAPAVYVSVDKDAIREEEAGTGWGSGSVALADLLDLLATVFSRRRPVGMDVCGELSPRLPGCPTVAERAIIARNERANLALLALWRRTAGWPGVAPGHWRLVPGSRGAA
ncbi:MAG TPA: hypothetical protein VIK92_00515 [Thermaerobacter sp.]